MAENVCARRNAANLGNLKVRHAAWRAYCTHTESAVACAQRHANLYVFKARRAFNSMNVRFRDCCHRPKLKSCGCGCAHSQPSLYMTADALVFQSCTRDVRITLCLDLLVVCYFFAWSRRGLLLYFPSRSGYDYSATYSFPLHWCMLEGDADNCTVYTLCLPVYRACVYRLHECLVCATMSFRPLAGATRHQRPCLHACTARPHHCLQVPSPGLEPPGCRSGPRSTFLVGCVVTLSLMAGWVGVRCMDCRFSTVRARLHHWTNIGSETGLGRSGAQVYHHTWRGVLEDDGAKCSQAGC